MENPDVSLGNNSAAQNKMETVKAKVSGCFRTQSKAAARCRLSSCLNLIAKLGYITLVAIQIALNDHAADIIKTHSPKHAWLGLMTHATVRETEGAVRWTVSTLLCSWRRLRVAIVTVG